MDDLLNITVIWFIIGFICFLLEFVVPGFIIFFFGIGAWIVAGLTLVSDVSINVQLIVFLASSLLSVLLFRNWIKAKLGMRAASPGLLEDEIIGKTAVASTSFLPGRTGKVYFKGASWDAQAEEPINEGDELTIIGYESIVLTVTLKKI
ncbi:NfeD family protein [Pedobacter psychroterrae]|uniref:NfeD-like C-terminal domain-containing protein n=1 Tax=Pedobacter psychroterrae TaxID=2530453 RepID=A0A4R0NRL0_9SPHI|nr:NfeD family protein [Pedobacter psychroterrae]TCD03506.1 hypothetical protein EZ437_05950 [Pedobacter psychroterrae]